MQFSSFLLEKSAGTIPLKAFRGLDVNSHPSTSCEQIRDLSTEALGSGCRQACLISIDS